MSGFQLLASYAEKLLQMVMISPGFEVGIWFLAWIFMWSGAVKLHRPELAAMAMMDFGVVRKFNPTLGRLLGTAEFGLAILLISGWLLGYTLLVSAFVLWVFTLLIFHSLLKGEEFACFCFGDAEATISRWTLVRTGALALLASILTLSPSVWTSEVVAYFSRSEGIVALAILGTIVLLACVPKLLTWNKNPRLYGA